MKLRVLSIASMLMLFALFSTDVFTFQGTPPTGRTGAPGESTCAAAGCHSGPPQATTLANLGILSNPPQAFTEYNPGQVYNLFFNISGLNNPNAATQKRGFSITCVDSSASATGAGTFGVTNASLTTLLSAGSKQYLGHNTADATGSFGFTWTAPAAGTGTVSFYTIVNASNNNGNTLGDAVYTQVYHIQEAGGPPAGDPCSNDSISVAITSTAANYCGSPFTLTANPTGNTNGISYTWSNNVDVSNGASATAVTSGTYSVTATTANCTAGKVATITIGSGQGTAAFMATANSDSTVTITNQSTNVQTIEWDFGNNMSNNNTDGSFTYSYSDTGTYTITLTVTDNCGATLTDTETITITGDGGGPISSVTEIDGGAIAVYPNPFNAYLNIEAPISDKQISFYLLSLDGKVAIEQKATVGLTRIERGDLEAGLYFYQFVTETGERLQTGRILAQ